MSIQTYKCSSKIHQINQYGGGYNNMTLEKLELNTLGPQHENVIHHSHSKDLCQLDLWVKYGIPMKFYFEMLPTEILLTI